MKRFLLLALVVIGCGWGCAGGQRTNGLCFVASAPDNPETWRELLLYGYDAKTHLSSRPALDCMGTPLFVQALDTDRCAETNASPEPLPAAPLGDADVTVTKLKDDRRLVWVQARHFVNGEAIGPVALIEPQGRGWAVRALGTLQTLGEKPQLRMETTGGVELLVAEGERCDPKKPTICARTARIMPLRFNRFIPEPFTAQNGDCAGSAFFHLYRLEEAKQPSGWKRRFELSSTLVFAQDGVAVHEQMTVSDHDPAGGDAPPRIIRRAQSDRTLKVEARRLVVDGDSLWTKVFPATNAR